MYKLPIMENVTNFDGTPIQDPTSKRPMTIKDVLMNYLGMFVSDNGVEIIQARQLGQRVYDHKEGNLECYNKDLDLIRKSLKTPKHIALIIAPVLEMINSVKDE